jgi:hypothetical protein
MAYTETMLSMIAKIRAITEDFTKTTSETFTYEDSNIFTIAEPKVNSVVDVLINGQELQSTQGYEFDPTTNDLIIVNEEYISGDITKVTYTYTNHSDSELFEYIRSALVFMSIYDKNVTSYKLSSSGLIIPSPAVKDLDLICMIASILIKPDFVSYKTSNMSIVYPTKFTKEEKIEKLIQKQKYGTGVVGMVYWDQYTYGEGII